jgi:FPC/CPF motif-containing protein YcgG
MQKRRLRRRVARIRSTMKVSQFGKQCRISICSSRAKTKAETWKITKLQILTFRLRNLFVSLIESFEFKKSENINIKTRMFSSS